MKRIVEPELLDVLPPGDPLAAGSRRDLCRVNAWMRNHIILADTLRNHLHGQAPEQITELGAGDGNFLLQVARRLSSFGVPSRTPRDGLDGSYSPNRVNAELQTPNRLKPGHQTTNVRATLLDRQKTVTPQTLDSFASLGWRVETITADVFDWLPGGNPAEVIVANLFLHHFHNVNLAEMFRAIAARARLFIAVEPRRASLPLLCSRWLWAIGCNCVTQHDAVVSVRAGFQGGELSALWPDKQNWQLTEHRAGAFSHLFVAQTIQPAT